MADKICYTQIKYGDIPAWYEIGWVDDQSMLQISIRNEVLEKFEQKITSKSLIIRAYQRDEMLSSFPLSLDTSGDWGFDRVFKKVAKDDIFTTYNINFKFTKDKELKTNLFKTLASLDILINFLTYVEIPTSVSTEPQLLHIVLAVDSNRSSLTVQLSKALVCWFRKFKFEKGQIDQRFEEVETVMRQVWLSTFPHDKNNSDFKLRIKCELKPGGLFGLQVQGNACDLSPVMCEEKKEGYELLSHNIDSSIQVIMFLAGLAKICSLWRVANK